MSLIRKPAERALHLRNREAEYYLREGYALRTRRATALRLYYGLKPALPRGLQLALRRAYARRIQERYRRPGAFPGWPIEPLLVERAEESIRARLRESKDAAVPLVCWWPEGRRFAWIVTHDVEGSAGVQNISRVLEVERQYGVVSSWNFVAEEYDLPDAVFNMVRDAGGEVGLHGIVHDGRLFRDRSGFERQLPAIRRYLREWGAVGFRSPATHRNADWMPELGCLYDSSFPDTDPFEPQPGGCCSIFPYFLDDLVELPLTMPQDHTLFEILREATNRIWEEKACWLIEHHGLVNILVHPDYVLTEERLRRYGDLLAFLASQDGGWHALPREVAGWWRERAACEQLVGAGDPGSALTLGTGRPAHVSPSVPRAVIGWATEDHGRIVWDAVKATRSQAMDEAAVD
jgi:peptidoglycan/xylan/chitin deacetylase (PgdA/CDA1 family)